MRLKYTVRILSTPPRYTHRAPISIRKMPAGLLFVSPLVGCPGHCWPKTPEGQRRRNPVESLDPDCSHYIFNMYFVYSVAQ